MARLSAVSFVAPKSRSELPRQSRRIITPQTAASSASDDFSGGIRSAFLWGLLALVALEVPSKTGLNLRKANIGTVLQSNDSDGAAVAIDLFRIERNDLAHNKLVQFATADLRIRHRALGCIDTLQSNRYAALVIDLHDDGVAIGDAHHAANLHLAARWSGEMMRAMEAISGRTVAS